MTAAHPENPVSEGVFSLEVRWIFSGQVDTTMAEWFDGFPAEVESREDSYLVNPELRGLSVKVRGGGALEVKVYRGSPGILDVAGRARGRMESWQKWSFPCDPPTQFGADLASWMPVRKRISRIPLASGRIGRQVEEPGCMVELTKVRTRGEVWWTLGFEATGPARLLYRELEATVAFIVPQALPDSMELDTHDSQSYAEWLGRRMP